MTGTAADPQVPGLIYASTLAGGVYASSDIGASWSPLNYGLSDGNLNAIALNRDGTFAHVAGRDGVSDYQFAADIWSDVKATPLTLTPGNEITLTARFGNNGPDDATRVTGTLTLPDDVSAPALADTAHGIYCTGGHVDVCTASILPAGTSFAVSLHLQAGGPGRYTSSADVSGVRLDPRRGDTSSATTITVSQSAARASAQPVNLHFTGLNGAVSPLTRRFQRANSIALGWSADGGTSTYDVRVRVASRTGKFGGYTHWRSGTTRTSGPTGARPDRRFASGCVPATPPATHPPGRRTPAPRSHSPHRASRTGPFGIVFAKRARRSPLHSPPPPRAPRSGSTASARIRLPCSSTAARAAVHSKSHSAATALPPSTSTPRERSEPHSCYSRPHDSTDYS